MIIYTLCDIKCANTFHIRDWLGYTMIAVSSHAGNDNKIDLLFAYTYTLTAVSNNYCKEDIQDFYNEN